LVVETLLFASVSVPPRVDPWSAKAVERTTMRNLHFPGRSPVHATEAMAATSQPLATATALAVMRDGGNAIDAAVAAAAVLAVVEPESTGIGGDCFVLLAPKGGARIVAYNGSGRAPAAATAEWYLERGIRTIDRFTPHAVTVPGAVDAWARLVEDHGSRDLGELLRPAIALAENGYPVHSRVRWDWMNEIETLKRNATARRLFVPGGKAPAVGSRHRQPELAATLKRIASLGRDGFYKGPVARDIVRYLRKLGGLHTTDDFAAAGGEYVAPIKTAYGGYEVFECPPNGQGIVALLMLNVLSGFRLRDLAPLSAARLHLEIEAARLAYRDRDFFVGDPRHAAVPVKALLSRARAAALRSAIDPERAMAPLPPTPLPEHPNTVCFSVVDRDRNAVSFINSLYHPFGSGLMAPKWGVMLQNRGEGFVVEPGHPNCIGPGKRPLHTIIPGMLAKKGRAVMPFGVMGGAYQAQGHVHLLTNVLDHGLDLQEAIDLPRLNATVEGQVDVEAGMPAEAVRGLEALGHRLVPAPKPIGGAQAIWIDWKRGVLTGASEPRKDGLALGY
jgi:gamma-glutamyltranspeptidase/glutathione hydrolase